jgi:hypothetical protein
MRASLLLLAALSLVLGNAVANCGDTSHPEVTVDTLVVGTYYLDVDCGPNNCGPVSVWIYQESNGKEGLQRDDEIVNDSCGGLYPADTIIF